MANRGASAAGRQPRSAEEYRPRRKPRVLSGTQPSPEGAKESNDTDSGGTTPFLTRTLYACYVLHQIDPALSADGQNLHRSRCWGRRTRPTLRRRDSPNQIFLLLFALRPNSERVKYAQR